METHRWRFYFDFWLSADSSSVLRSVSAALSRFKVCRLWGRAWLLWVSTTPQKLWWYRLDCMLLCSVHVHACPCILCTNLCDVFWLPVDPGPWGERVLTVGGWGGGAWLSCHSFHSHVEKSDNAGHEPQLHQHHRRIRGETHPPNLNTVWTSFHNNL